MSYIQRLMKPTTLKTCALLMSTFSCFLVVNAKDYAWYDDDDMSDPIEDRMINDFDGTLEHHYPWPPIETDGPSVLNTIRREAITTTTTNAPTSGSMSTSTLPRGKGTKPVTRPWPTESYSTNVPESLCSDDSGQSTRRISVDVLVLYVVIAVLTLTNIVLAICLSVEVRENSNFLTGLLQKVKGQLYRSPRGTAVPAFDKEAIQC